VIIDSRTVIENAWRTAALRYTGRVLNERDIHEHVHGRAGSHTVTALFPEHDPEQRKQIWFEVDQIEEKAPYQPILGVLELIAALRETAVTIGLVTSSWPAKIGHVLGLFGLQDAFQAVVSRDDITLGKPHPDPYLIGCQQIGATPGETLVFEDSFSGVRSATGAGTVCVGIGDDTLVEAGAVDAVADFTGLAIATRGSRRVLTGVNPEITLLG
jgi:HAD superfamily hydrolase (TIGR01509 family)